MSSEAALWTHECPNCGELIDSDFGEGDFTCPECGENFTIEIGDDDE